jgi:hypothetical protein
MSGMVDPRASSHKTSASRGASWLTLGRLAAARRSAPEQCARRTAESTSANPLSLDTHWAAPAATAIVAETASRFDANVTRVMEGCAFRSRRTQSRPLTPPTPNVTNATSTVASLSRCVAAGNVNAQPADLNPAWNSIARANDSANARSSSTTRTLMSRIVADRSTAHLLCSVPNPIVRFPPPAHASRKPRQSEALLLSEHEASVPLSVRTLRAAAIACKRLRACNFCMIALTCTRAVFGEIPSVAAMEAVEHPPSRSSNTSSSRVVRRTDEGRSSRVASTSRTSEGSLHRRIMAMIVGTDRSLETIARTPARLASFSTSCESRSTTMSIDVAGFTFSATTIVDRASAEATTTRGCIPSTSRRQSPVVRTRPHTSTPGVRLSTSSNASAKSRCLQNRATLSVSFAASAVPPSHCRSIPPSPPYPLWGHRFRVAPTG